jgi:hypothetical protein
MSWVFNYYINVVNSIVTGSQRRQNRKNGLIYKVDIIVTLIEIFASPAEMAVRQRVDKYN